MQHIKRVFLFAAILLLFLTGCMSGKKDTPPSPSLELSPVKIAESSNPITTSSYAAPDLEWARAESQKRYLDADVIYPISHVMTQFVAPVGACDFFLHGFYGVELRDDENSYSRKQIMINAIEIIAVDDDFYQLIDGLSTSIRTYYDDYGFSFEDWNSDGAIDIKLHEWEGGSMRNEPSLFWLWDDSARMFVENDELGEISETASVYMNTDMDNLVRAFTSAGVQGSATGYYEYIDGHFVCVGYVQTFIDKDGDTLYWVTQESELINGEMQIVDESRIIIDPGENSGAISEFHPVVYTETTVPGDDGYKNRLIFRICGLYDLNGDGAMEILTSWRFYEGLTYDVYEIDGAEVTQVIGNWIGS